MKKNLILSLTLLLGLTACQKDNKTTSVPSGSNKPNFGEKHLSLAPAYTDMTLNSDGSYSAYWNDCLIRVTNPAWDQLKYPTLVNGVPVRAGEMSTYDGTSGIGLIDSGPDGNVFQVTQRYISLPSFNSSGFQTDMTAYFSAVLAYLSQGNPTVEGMPHIGNYVKDTYTFVPDNGPSIKSFTGKLIRVTTGSHLAIATISYPLPAASSMTNNPLGHPAVFDAVNTQSYAITGSYNFITSAINGLGAKCPASGTYQFGPGGAIYLVGSIIRPDGSVFSFNTTVAP